MWQCCAARDESIKWAVCHNCLSQLHGMAWHGMVWCGCTVRIRMDGAPDFYYLMWCDSISYSSTALTSIHSIIIHVISYLMSLIVPSHLVSVFSFLCFVMRYIVLCWLVSFSPVFILGHLIPFLLSSSFHFSSLLFSSLLSSVLLSSSHLLFSPPLLSYHVVSSHVSPFLLKCCPN